MRPFTAILVSAAASLILASTATASSTLYLTDMERAAVQGASAGTKKTCDHRTVQFHVKKAKRVIDYAFRHKGWDKGSDWNRKRARRVNAHRQCLLPGTGKQRKAINTHLKRKQKSYGKWVAKQKKKADPFLAAYERRSGADKAWATSTGSCEAGNNPGAHNSSGIYHGAFQFLLGTWGSSPGSPGGDPHLYPWTTQAEIALRLRDRDGSGHWPNCG